MRSAPKIYTSAFSEHTAKQAREGGYGQGEHLLNIRPHTINLGNPLAKHLVSMLLMVRTSSFQPHNNKGAPKYGPIPMSVIKRYIEPLRIHRKILCKKRKQLIN